MIVFGMLFFLLSVLPLTYIYIYCGRKNCPVTVSVPELFFLPLCGIFFASFYCIIKFFFILEPVTQTFGLFSLFFTPFFGEIVVPFLLCAFLFFVFVRESVRYKLERFPLFLFGFYMVFFPCTVIRGGTDYPFFILFIKPVLYAQMLYASAFVFVFFTDFIACKKITLSRAVLVIYYILVLILPAITDVVRLLNIAVPLWIFPLAVSSLMPFLIRFFAKKIGR